jgi:acyl-CoA thioesterase FadM
VTNWFQTYRGIVNPWECDVVQHFTIAYYFDRFADARRNLFDLIGEGKSVVAGVRWGASRSHVTFQQELRAGAAFHILSAVTRFDGGVLQLGHQVTDSPTGKTLTWVSEALTLPKDWDATTQQKWSALAVAWPGPPPSDRPASRALHGLLSARDRVKPWEIGEDGTMSLPAHVHRFSAAGMQILAAIGMTADYMERQRRGFSTFELDLDVVGEAYVGEIVDVTTSLLHLGNSSLRLAHRMTGPKGREIAHLVQSGVHLDMDARRSTAIPDPLRDAIGKLLVRQP